MQLQGELHTVDVPNIVELARQMNGPVVITITSPHGQGKIVVADGEVVHAEYEGQTGTQAFYRLMALSDGSFDLQPAVEVPAITIEMPWNTLLLSALKYLDEQQASEATEESKANAGTETVSEPKTRKEVIAQHLDTWLERASAIEEGAVVGVDGLVLAASAASRFSDEELVGAVAAAIYALSTRSVQQLKRGNLIRTLVQGSRGNIIVTVIDSQTLFVGLTAEKANLGIAFAEARTIVQDLAKLLKG